MSQEPGQRERQAHDALSDAYEQHYNPLVRLCGLLAGDRETAEDIVQDIFVRSAARITELSPDELGPYLRAAVTNEWKNKLRRRALDRRIRPRLLLTHRHERDRDEREDMWRAILRLPPRQRACLVLRYYEDLSEQQTADVLRCSVGTVKSQTSRALVKLRKEFEP